VKNFAVANSFVAARGVIPKDAEATAFWIVAACAWIFVPFYFWFATTRDGKPPLKTQVALATIAFPVWVFAIGGLPVTSWPWYNEHEYIGSIVLMFVTVAFGLIQPSRRVTTQTSDDLPFQNLGRSIHVSTIQQPAVI
jgi:hypothetical protein